MKNSNFVLKYECAWCGEWTPEFKSTCTNCGQPNPEYNTPSAFSSPITKKSAIDERERRLREEELSTREY